MSSRGNVLLIIATFAKSSGGVLVVVVEDQTRHVCSVADSLDAQERLANIVSTGVSPSLMPAIEVSPWRDGVVVAVEVSQSYLRPILC